MERKINNIRYFRKNSRYGCRECVAVQNSELRKKFCETCYGTNIWVINDSQTFNEQDMRASFNAGFDSGMSASVAMDWGDPPEGITFDRWIKEIKK